MNRKTRVKHINDLVATLSMINKATEALKLSVGCVPESPLNNAIASLESVAIEATAIVIGDLDEWLYWFVYENECGAGAKRANICGKMYKACTASELITIIDKCNKS